MDLSFAEVCVLAAAARAPITRRDLAARAAEMYQSTKYDAALALVDIKTCEERRFVKPASTGLGYGPLLTLTYEGWSALIQSLPVLENVRAAVAGARYNPVIR